jgi:cation:H+ antiporter
VAYGVTGAMLVFQRRKQREMVALAATGAGSVGAPTEVALCSDEETARLAKDQTWFLLIFIVKVALGLVAFAFKPTLGLLFFAAYAVYFWRELRGGPDQDPGRSRLLLATMRTGELSPARLSSPRFSIWCSPSD